jgi:uncharacterized membrane protein YraQ (UPF0718 family)/copper chaperone CopZ
MDHMHHMTNAAPAGYDFWAHLRSVPGEGWHMVTEMAPYLLLGFLIAGLLSVLVSPKMVERHLGGKGFWPVFKAALLGVPLPLCSCGVIPVSASLRRHKASKGATTAFLISTPQTGVDSIAVTYSLLGPVFAIFRPVAAFITGIIGGAIVAAVTHEHEQHVPEDLCREACCIPSEKPRSRLLEIFRYGFVILPRDIGKSLVVGLVVAALIGAVLPRDFFAPYLGGGGIFPIFVMMLVGIPIYVCSTASVPVAAAMILYQGISPGAAFAFLVTGPATNVATVATVWKVMGRQTAIIYLATVAGGAVVGGLLLDYVLKYHGAVGMPGGGEMLPSWFAAACGVVLLGVLAMALFGRAIFPPGSATGADEHANDHEGHAHDHAAPTSTILILGVIIASVGLLVLLYFWIIYDTGVETAYIKVYNLDKGNTKICGIIVGVGCFLGGLVTAAMASLEGKREAPAHDHDHLPARFVGASDGAASPLDELSLKISGMHCSHCADAIKRAIMETDGVRSATVDLAGAAAKVSGRNLDAAKIRQAIASLGYTVVG